MAWYRAGGGGIPSSLKTDMNAVLNKKFGTSTTYPPNGWPDDVNLLGPLPERTASGSIAHITDGADAVPLKNWAVTLPASLSGYSSIECTKAKKNIANLSFLNFSNSTYANTRYYASEPLLQDLCALFDELKTKSATYIFSMAKTGTDVGLTIGTTRFHTSNGWVLTLTPNTAFTLPDTVDFSEVDYVTIYGSTSGATVSDVQIEVGSTATTYEAYAAPTTSTVSLGRTIYGGTVDVVTGEGTETHNRTPLDDKTYNYASNIERFNVAISGAYSSGYADNFVMPAGYTLSHVLIQNAANAPDMTMCMYNGSLYIKNLSCTTREELQTALSGEYLTFPLATTEDFTFDPLNPTPETALGVNNFWADAGDSSVTYRADIDLLLGGN